MNRQVETILKASQLEKQEVDLNLKPLHVHDIIRDVVDNFSLQLQDKQGRVELDLSAANDLIQADERVDLFVQRGREILGEALRHAAGDDQLLLAAALLHALVLVDLEDVADRLLLGGIDEGAGVDDDDIGLIRVIHEGERALLQLADHDLAVDPVLRATQADEVDSLHHIP